MIDKIKDDSLYDADEMEYKIMVQDKINELTDAVNTIVQVMKDVQSDTERAYHLMEDIK